MGDFTGFIAYCDAHNENDLKARVVIKEKENYYDPQLDRTCATNWHTVRHKDIITLELWWHGEKKEGFEHNPQEWIFYHSGISENGKTRTVSRSIGFRTPETSFICTVDEETGQVTHSME